MFSQFIKFSLSYFKILASSLLNSLIHLFGVTIWFQISHKDIFHENTKNIMINCYFRGQHVWKDWSCTLGFNHISYLVHSQPIYHIWSDNLCSENLCRYMYLPYLKYVVLLLLLFCHSCIVILLIVECMLSLWLQLIFLSDCLNINNIV